MIIMALKLYEISEDIQYIIDNPDISDEAKRDSLELLGFEFEDKVEATALTVKNMSAESKAIADEIKSLQERKKSLDNKVEWIKQYILFHMLQTKTDKIVTAKVSVSTRKNPDKLLVSPEDGAEDRLKEWLLTSDDEVLQHCVKVETLKELRKKELLDYFKANPNEVDKIDGVRVVKDSKGITIK